MPQRRVYIPNAVYHISFNTKGRIHYFEEDIFCCILGDVILSSEKVKDYVVLAYKINPEHVHLLVKCGDHYNISDVMHCIKRVSAVKINQLITKGTIDERVKLAWSEELQIYRKAFGMKYGYPSGFPFPIFKWQEGFYDVIIQSYRQLQGIIDYIRKQAMHHELPENIHLYISQSLPDNIVYPNLLIRK